MYTRLRCPVRLLIVVLFLLAGFSAATRAGAEPESPNVWRRRAYLPRISAPPPATPPQTIPDVYLGAYIAPDYNVFPNQIRDFESRVGKKHAIYHYFIDWVSNGDYSFNVHLLDSIANNGSTPMLTWMSFNPYRGNEGCDDAEWNLDSISSGKHDGYIRSFAQGLAGYRHTVLLRWGHEMNLVSYSWAGSCNGRDPAKFVTAFRHIHDIFVSVGAKNVKFVWSPNYKSFPVESWNDANNYYPGDAYVDWIGLVGYNWGASSQNNNYRWLTWTDLFDEALRKMTDTHPSKPLMIADYASVDGDGGSRSTWITDAFAAMLRYPHLHAVVWYNGLPTEPYWKVESVQGTLDAYRRAISNSYFKSAAPYP